MLIVSFEIIKRIFKRETLKDKFEWTIVSSIAGVLSVCLIYYFASYLLLKSYFEAHRNVLDFLVLDLLVYYLIPSYACWCSTCFIFESYRREAARIHALHQIRESALKARNALLRQQINPHFLFNALNALYTLIALREREKAQGVIAAIIRFVNRIAPEGQDMVPLSQELELQDAYLEIEQVRFGERLKVERRVAEGVEQAQVPFLILQPLVENAVKHSLARTSETVRLEILADRAGEELVLTVKDSGAAATAGPPPPGLGVGLKNVEERLKALYGAAGRFTTRKLEPQGFVAEVRLPLAV